MTESREITRLMDNARLHVPGALDAALKLELFNTFDDFLQRSLFWQESIDYMTSVGRTSYELAGTEDGAIVSLVSNVNGSDTPIRATMDTLGAIELAITPAQVEELTATVAYTVVDPVDVDDYPRIPDLLLSKYGAGILAGLIARMMSQPAKPYTNERLAIFNSRKFNAAVATARAAVAHANLHGGQTWRFPSFGPGSQR
jgi:hypothetical protein